MFSCIFAHSMVNQFMPNGLFYLSFLDRSISDRRGVVFVFIIKYFIEIPVFNANSVDPDQKARSTASDLGLHYLQMSF